MPKTIRKRFRDAINGFFISEEDAKNRPDTTVSETYSTHKLRRALTEVEQREFSHMLHGATRFVEQNFYDLAPARIGHVLEANGAATGDGMRIRVTVEILPGPNA